MRCPRCHGLMVPETFHDFDGSRCISCGNLWDPMIAANREYPQTKAEALKGSAPSGS